MKNYLHILSILLTMMLCIGMLAACGTTANTGSNSNNAQVNAPVSQETDPVVDEAVPFVAPADQIGVVLSPDGNLITWLPYATTEETIDFKGIKIADLGQPGEMALLYLVNDVTYYVLVDGKMEKVSEEELVDVLVKDSVIGVTTLEEGVQEVYILSVPVDSDEYEEVVLEEDDT